MQKRLPIKPFTRINQLTIMLVLIYFSKNKFVGFLWLVAKWVFLLRISQCVFCREMIVHSVDIHFSHLSEVAGEVLTVRFCVFQSKIIVNYGIKIWIRWKSSSEIGRTLIFSQLSVEYVILHNGCHGRFEVRHRVAFALLSPHFSQPFLWNFLKIKNVKL